MSQLFLFADVLWKLLVIAALSSSLLLGAFLLVQPLLRKISGQLYNRMAQISVSSLLGVLFFSFFLLLSVDQNLQEKCFGVFASTQGSFGVTRMLALLWALGALILGTRDFALYFRFKKMLQGKTLRIQREFTLVEKDLPPMTFGLANPQILVPQDLLQDQALPFVLAHEKIHQLNQDGLWSLLALIVQRLYWFNPLNVWFERGRRLAMEMATDELTIERNNFDPVSYSRAMLTVLRRGVSSKSNRMAFGAALSFDEMKIRLENLHSQRSARRKGYYKMAALSILAGGWFLGVGQSFASIQIHPVATDGMMCYQVQHEKVLESWLHLQTEANKCEEILKTE